MTSRLETSRYRDFSQFFESIGLGLKNFGLEKKSRYRSRKYLVSKKSLGISSPISLGCRSMLLRQPKLEEKMLSICRSSMLSAVSAC